MEDFQSDSANPEHRREIQPAGEHRAAARGEDEDRGVRLSAICNCRFAIEARSAIAGRVSIEGGRSVRIAGANCRKAQPKAGDAGEDTQASIGEGDADFSSPQEQNGFHTERRERGEPAEQAGEQEQPGVGGEEVALDHKAGEDARDETADHVDEERAEREFPVGGGLKDQAAHFPPGDCAQGAAQSDEQELSHESDSN